MPVPALVLRDSATYPPQLASVPRARRRIARVVGAWDCAELVADAALLGSELVSNALLHGCLRDRLFRVEVVRTVVGVRVSVTDPVGERWPQPRTADAVEQFGRGLAVVQALASRWGVLARTVGKTVWADLDGSVGATDAYAGTSRPPGSSRSISTAASPPRCADADASGACPAAVAARMYEPSQGTESA
ncbi:hypothetical protein DSC45_01605 [Streptomyces sp. YIM 130001]|nr:hypothetical protein DSC45_01605 [Streptomyces sp. YIM 130001]